MHEDPDEEQGIGKIHKGSRSKRLAEQRYLWCADEPSQETHQPHENAECTSGLGFLGEGVEDFELWMGHYKTAWRMYKQIRSMLIENLVLEGESVEVDETYIGGKRHGTRGRGAKGKSIVAGAVERGGRIVARKIPNVKARTLLPFVKEKVLPRSIVYTDELKSYDNLKRMGYEHKRVHHASKVYVMGDAHTNSIEGFWSLVKRGINGVYHAVSDKYLQSYLNEYAFRYNRRNNGAAIFGEVVSRIVPS